MRVRLLLPLLPLVVLNVSGINVSRATPHGISINADFGVIGPFHEYCDDFTLEGSYKPMGTAYKIRDRIIVGETISNPFYVETKKAHDAIAKRTEYVTFNLPFSNALGSNGLECQFQIINEDDEVLTSFFFRIKPVTPKRINVKDYINTVYSVEDVIVDPDNYGASRAERFYFNGFLDYFNVDTYYRLDISNLYFLYDCPKFFRTSYGSLHFIDYDRLFPFLDNDATIPEFDIPVVTTSKTFGFGFKFDTTFYVDPVTLEMSFDARPGFQKTKYFYLPINKCEQLIDRVFTLKMSRFGYGEISFDWDIRYLNNRSLVGSCDNSDYCVRGEIK